MELYPVKRKRPVSFLFCMFLARTERILFRSTTGRISCHGIPRAGKDLRPIPLPKWITPGSGVGDCDIYAPDPGYMNPHTVYNASIHNKTDVGPISIEFSKEPAGYPPYGHFNPRDQSPFRGTVLQFIMKYIFGQFYLILVWNGVGGNLQIDST